MLDKLDEKERQYHEVAQIFPLMQGEEFEALKADIATNGLLEPIWLHPDGSIIDGRNRHRACVDLGISPQFRTWDGDGSLISFVVSLNLHRRHLSKGQAAMIALDVLPLLEEEARERQLATLKQNESTVVEIIPQRDKGKARDKAGELLGVNGRYVSDAKRLQDKAPDLAADVRESKKSLPWAMRVLHQRRSSEKKNAPPPKPSKRRPLVILGDAKRIPLKSESVDVIITSPPYNLGQDSWAMGGYSRRERESGIGYDDRMADEHYQEWQLMVISELYRVARPGASFFYNHKPRTQNGRLLHPLSWLFQVNNWTLRQEIIWDRQVTHNHSSTLFWPIDERIYWFTKGKPALYSESIGMPTVWSFHGPAPHTWHPAPFSDNLPRNCLRAVGGEKLTVLDPFSGSGTTAKVAREMGHFGIALDINKDYVQRIRSEGER